LSAWGIEQPADRQYKRDIGYIAPDDVSDCDLGVPGQSGIHADDELRQRGSECDNSETDE
jgi:hypothetical protein